MGALEPEDTLLVTDVQYPLKVLKTAVQAFVSSLGNEFTDDHRWMRPFLLNREARHIPDYFHAYAYAMVDPYSGRSSGPMVAGRFTDGGGMTDGITVAEFAAWPIGLMISYHDLSGLPLAPITQWAHYHYDERGGVSIALPIHSVATPFPLDFRTPDEVERDIRAGSQSEG
jgi:hypothetical protein